MRQVVEAAFQKRQEICERKMCVTVPFTTPYSVNIVWVSCLCVLWEGARQSNAYRHMQSGRNGWLAAMANKHIIHSVDPRDSFWICLQSECVCGAMCYACCFLCVYCVQSLHIRLASDRFGLRGFSRVCVQQDENVWFYFFFSLMSSFLNLKR